MTRHWMQTVTTALDRHVAVRGDPPVCIVAAGIGVFATGATPSRAATARELFADAIRIGFAAVALGGVRPLAPAERAFIETWEAETYRLSVTGG